MDEQVGEWQPFPMAPEHCPGRGEPAYRLRGNEVEFRGKVRQADGGQYTTGCDWQLGTMPIGWRPATVTHRIVAVEMGASVYYARLEVGADGTVIVNVPPGSTSTSHGLHWIALDGVTYPLPQPAATAA